MKYSETHSNLECKINMPAKDMCLCLAVTSDFNCVISNWRRTLTHPYSKIILSQRNSQTYILKKKIFISGAMGG